MACYSLNVDNVNTSQAAYHLPPEEPIVSSTLLVVLRFTFRALARVAPQTAGRLAYRLFTTPRQRATVPKKLEVVMARAESFEVQAAGVRIAAYRWKARANDESSTPPRVMLVHGWESRAARLAIWVEPLLEAGFEVVAFDAPAHGASDGRRANPRAFVDSMHAVIAQSGPVSACLGHSLGGLASLMAIGGGRLLGRPNLEVERMIILAGANSGADAMGMFCDVLGLGGAFKPLLLAAAAEAAGRPIPDFDGHRLFADRPIPTLWFHDPEDDEVPFSGAEKLAQACPHVTLKSTEGVGHHRIVRAPGMIREGTEFLAHLHSDSTRHLSRLRAGKGIEDLEPAALEVFDIPSHQRQAVDSGGSSNPHVSLSSHASGSPEPAT